VIQLPNVFQLHVVAAVENISTSLELKFVMSANPLTVVPLLLRVQQFNALMDQPEDALESVVESLMVLANG